MYQVYKIMNDKFNNRIQGLPSEISELIRQVDELRGQWVEGADLDRQVLTRLRKSVLVTSTGASTRIEGSELSDEDVEKLMRGLSLKRFKSRDTQEVQGYYELLTNVFNSYQSIPFSEGTIKFFHRELLKHASKDDLHRGEYKKKENRVEMVNAAGDSVGVLFETTPAYLTSKEMLELVEWTQQAIIERKIHPLIIIGNFIVEFLSIHPFEDGNGRLSRILTNLLLLQQGYAYIPYISHEKIIEDNKAEYYLALRQSQRTFRLQNNDMTPWMRFFLNVLLTQSKQALDLLAHAQTEQLLSPQQELVWKNITQTGTAVPSEIALAAGVPRPTVNQALQKLLRLKMIERIGSGRSTRYKRK
ncbi:Fic family protein [bacterium]|nr:MAG: Fic family protein [bacterium]